MVRDERGALRAGSIACLALLLGGLYLVVTARPSPAAAGWHAPAEIIDPAHLERRAEAALERWRSTDELDDEPANPDNGEPIDAYDGHYVGMAVSYTHLTLPTKRIV